MLIISSERLFICLEDSHNNAVIHSIIIKKRVTALISYDTFSLFVEYLCALICNLLY